MPTSSSQRRSRCRSSIASCCARRPRMRSHLCIRPGPSSRRMRVPRRSSASANAARCRLPSRSSSLRPWRRCEPDGRRDGMHGNATGLLHAWHDFYVLIGTAAATLIGLMFVAASISASYMTEKHQAGIQSFYTPTVVHFATVLITCVVLVAPLGAMPLGALLLGDERSLEVLAIAIVLLLLAAIRNAWDITAWAVTRSGPSP